MDNVGSNRFRKAWPAGSGFEFQPRIKQGGATTHAAVFSRLMRTTEFARKGAFCAVSTSYAVGFGREFLRPFGIGFFDTAWRGRVAVRQEIGDGLPIHRVKVVSGGGSVTPERLIRHVSAMTSTYQLPKSMQAWVYSNYGGPSELKLEDRPLPTPRKGQVLIAVHAVSVNSSDVEFLHGRPYYTRMWGLRKPKLEVLGTDVSGTVVQVGADVEGFALGDKVYGDILGGKGALSSFACCKAVDLLHMPENLSFSEAALLPQTGAVAIQGLNYKGGPKKGQRVLILGAGGGSGSFAVQIAKHKGVHVTAVDAAHKLDFMRALGADEVWDYRQTNFSKTGQTWDYILDLIGAETLSNSRRSLDSKGRFVLVGGQVGRILSVWIGGGLVSMFSSKKSIMMGVKQNKKLGDLVKLLEAGAIQLQVDAVYPFENAPNAFERLEAKKNCGKVLVSLVPD